MTAEGTPADAIAALARELASEDDSNGLLRRLVDAAVFQVDGAEHAGITVLATKSVQTVAATDDRVEQIDRHQYAAGEGPCLTAAAGEVAVVRVDDLDTDLRWPNFAPAAIRLGVRSMLSFHLYTHRDTIGALNLYAATPNAFTDASVHTGTLLAAHAGLAAAATLKQVQLLIALDSRDVIGQAKGILMERYKITAHQAFDLLVTASQQTHMKLHELARELTETGELKSQ